MVNALGLKKNFVLLLLAFLFYIPSFSQNAAADTIRKQLAALKPGTPHYLDTKIGMLGTLFISIVNTDPQEAMKVSEQLAQCEKEKGDSVGYYRAFYRSKARAYEKMGDYTNNILNLEAYAEAMNRLGKDDSYTYVDEGNAYFAFNLRGLAKACYRQAEELFKKEKNIEGLCTVHNNYAQIYMIQQQYDSALYELHQVHELRMNKLKDPALAGDSKLLIGICYYDLQQYDSAEFYYRQVIALLDSPELKAHTDHVALQEEYSAAYGRLASVYISRKNWDSASFYLQKGFDFSREAGYTNRVTNMYVTWARFYLGRGMMDSAFVNTKRFEKAIALKNNPDESRRLLLKLYTDYYKALGDSLQYYKYLSAYYILDDSLNLQMVNEGSLLASGSIMQMKNKSRIERQSQELARKDSVVARQEKEKILLYAVSGLFLFIIGAGLFLFVQIRKKNKLIGRYNNELKEANATKEKFLSVISHDLRNPFNTLIGMSNVLVTNVREQKHAQVLASAEAINESSRKAYVLLDNLMQWVSLQKEKISVNKEVLPVNETVENVLRLFRNQALAQSVIIKKDIRTSGIFTDKNLLQVVLRNLLSNAIRHIPVGGTIQLCVEERGEDVLIIVQDNGHGIEEETLKTLFAKKEHTSIARKGGGLGLLLVQEFVEQLGGEIRAENIPSGGAKFTIVLYKAAVKDSLLFEEKPESRAELRFTESEKKKMAVLVSELRKYEIFDTTELRTYLDSFDTEGSAALEEWIKNLSKAVYLANNEQFGKLMNLASA